VETGTLAGCVGEAGLKTGCACVEPAGDAIGIATGAACAGDVQLPTLGGVVVGQVSHFATGANGTGNAVCAKGVEKSTGASGAAVPIAAEIFGALFATGGAEIGTGGSGSNPSCARAREVFIVPAAAPPRAASSKHFRQRI